MTARTEPARVRSPFRVVLALALAHPVLVPGATSPALDGRPRISIEPGSWDFGNAGPGETLHHDFVIRNTGASDLVIHRIASACACAAAIVGRDVIPPDGEAVMKVTLETRRYRGVLERWLTVASSDPGGNVRVRVRVYIEDDQAPAQPEDR